MSELTLSIEIQSVLSSLRSSIVRDFAPPTSGLEAQIHHLMSALYEIGAVLLHAEEKAQENAIFDLSLRDAVYEASEVIEELSIEAVRRHVLQNSRRGVPVLAELFSLPHQLKFRRKFSTKLRAVNVKLDIFRREKDYFDLRLLNFEGPSKLSETVLGTTSFLGGSTIIGRDDEKDKIIDLLINRSTENDDLFVYAICGVVGIGKTALAQLIYNDEMVSCSYQLRYWVHVYDNFNIDVLMRKILASHGDPESEHWSLDTMFRRFQEETKDKKFLLVLDDVWNVNPEKWERLKDILLICGANRSAVIVTTRISTVASVMASSGHILHLKGLSERDSLFLFKREAFAGRDEEQYMRNIRRSLLKICRGLPLAIVSVGRLMRTKRGEEEWKSVTETEIYKLEILNSFLRTNLSRITPNSRQCFLYCSVFPKGFELDKDFLIQLWMANGFIPPSTTKDWYEMGQEIFQQLYDLSFLEEVDALFYQGTKYKVQDLMQDVASSAQNNEIFRTGSMIGRETNSQIRHMWFDVKSTSGEIIQPRNFGSLRSLFLLSDEDMEVTTIPSLLSSQKYLRVLSIQQCEAVQVTNALGFLSRKEQPQRMSIQRKYGELPYSIDCSKLMFLRHLNLSYSHIEVLPISVTRLLNLQSLSLRKCLSLYKLPAGMTDMKSLSYLDIRGCVSLISMPDMRQLKKKKFWVNGLVVQIGDRYSQFGDLSKLSICGCLSLKQLERIKDSEEAKRADLERQIYLESLNLSWEDNGKESKAAPDDIINALRPHKQLERIKDSEEAKRADLERQRDLESLNLSWEDNGKESKAARDDIINALKPHKYLKAIRLDSYPGSNFPRWLTEYLQNLVSVTLHECQKCKSLPPLEKLHSLRDLQIQGMPKVQYLVSKSYEEPISLFPALRILDLENMPSLVAWERPNSKRREIFPQLHRAFISKCGPSDLTIGSKLTIGDLSSVSTLVLSDHNAETFPDGLGNLTRLQFLEVSSCKKLVSLGNAISSSLKTLWIMDCDKLVSLPEGLKYLEKLQDLFIRGCPELNSFPEGMERLNALETLQIRECLKFSSLPDSIGDLKSLIHLKIQSCPSLASLPNGMRNSKSLKYLEIARCPDLERRCVKKSQEDGPHPKNAFGLGEDWPKISHIDKIWINYEPVEKERKEDAGSTQNSPKRNPNDADNVMSATNEIQLVNKGKNSKESGTTFERGETSKSVYTGGEITSAVSENESDDEIQVASKIAEIEQREIASETPASLQTFNSHGRNFGGEEETDKAPVSVVFQVPDSEKQGYLHARPEGSSADFAGAHNQHPSQNQSDLNTMAKSGEIKMVAESAERHLNLTLGSLSSFRYIIGNQAQSMLPSDAESELQRWDKYVSYANGREIPTELRMMLSSAAAFFLDRHATVTSLSSFGIKNMELLRCCVICECNQLQMIVDEEEQGMISDNDEGSQPYNNVAVLKSLEYLFIYRMEQFRSIWEGTVSHGESLALLRVLTLRECPRLTCVFGAELLNNLGNLEEVNVEDCSSLTTLVRYKNTDKQEVSNIFLPKLKKVLLDNLPNLTTIGMSVSLKLVKVSNCPNLQPLPPINDS